MNSSRFTPELRSLKAGDVNATQELWEKYFTSLEVAVRRLGRGLFEPALAPSEIAHSVFSSFVRLNRLGHFQDIESREELWRILFTLARSKMIAEAHKRRDVLRNAQSLPHPKLDQLQASTYRSFEDGVFIHEFLSTISDEPSRKIAEMLLLGYTRSDIVNALSVSRSSVDRKIRRIRTSLSVYMSESIDSVCDVFERELRSPTKRPRLRQFISQHNWMSIDKIFPELLLLELEYVFPGTLSRSLEDSYISQFPEFKKQIHDVFRQAREAAYGADSQARESTTYVPNALGGYEIEERLGEGGFAIVYRARDKTGRAVAIKAMKSAWSTEASVRFLDEISYSKALSHPNLVRVLDAGIDEDGTQFVVYDLIDGQSLQQFMQEKSTPKDEVVRIIEEVSRAVHVLHAHSVVHRDIKPSNILLSASGHPVLVDFGLAVPIERSSHSIGGTVGYAAPEQLRGEALDNRSDVFSLGAVLYQALTGTLPFAKHDDATSGRFRPVRQLNESVSLELALICEKALSLSPKDRFSTAEELADALSEVRCPFISIEDSSSAVELKKLAEELREKATEIRREMQIYIPSHCSLGQSIELSLALIVTEFVDDSTRRLAHTVGIGDQLKDEVVVRVTAPAFKLRECSQSMSIPAVESTDFVRFELKSEKPGCHAIEIELFRKGRRIGYYLAETAVGKNETP